MQAEKLSFERNFQVVLTDDHAQVAAMMIEPGESVGGSENRHRGADQWLFVVSGRGTAIVNEERRDLEPGMVMLIERGDTHEIRNTGDEPLRTVNFYSPPAYTKTGDELPAGKGE